MKILFGLLILLSLGAAAQNDGKISEAWYGRWCGQMRAGNADGRNMTADVSLEIRPESGDSSWQWIITYGYDGSDIRNYRLVTTDQPGKYILDEGNSIILDMYLSGNSFHSLFSVGNSILYAVYTLEEETILYNILVYDNNSLRKSGGVSGDVPEVSSYPVMAQQQAVLKKSSCR